MSSLGTQIGQQGDLVRQLKADKASKDQITAAISQLKELKLKLEEELKVNSAGKDATKAFRAGFEDLMLRKFFYVPSFEIYGGVGGLYDFGPPGCAVKSNILDLWRRHFVLTENMLEVSCSALTPHTVLKTSGHVDKFSDFMVKDVKTGDCFRADKLLEDVVDELIDTTAPSKEARLEMLAARTDADACSVEQLGLYLTKYNAKAPVTGNDISAPFPFNLMFQTSIGPTGKAVGFMRPETAQGIFVNFRRLLEFNGGRMPFAAAQIGLAFRNEISPRSGLLRVREFPLAEIEHFVNPDDKTHPKFAALAGHRLNLLSKALQTGEDIHEEMVIGEAVTNGTVANETLAYFLCRTHMFLLKCGIKPDKLRFRQHKDTEMAHYATDCWDAEIFTTYGWIECVGHADRSAYDLRVHSDKTKVDLSAQESYDVPRIVEEAVANLNHGLLGKTFRKESKLLVEHLKALDSPAAMALQAQLAAGEDVVVTTPCGKEFKVNQTMVSFKLETRKISVRKYLPGVIEPSFGIGRIMYAVLEHAYVVKKKGDDEQGMLALSPYIAPVKASLCPLASTPEMAAIVAVLERDLVSLNLASKTDPSGASIGRKYARSDEIGVPFCIVIDFESHKLQDVTIRDRDSTTQIRVQVKDAAKIVQKLCAGRLTWEKARATYRNFSATEE